MIFGNNDENRRRNSQKRKKPMMAEKTYSRKVAESLPEWKVIFHFPLQQGVTFHNAIEAVHIIARLVRSESEKIVREAREFDEVLVLKTHRERAELYQEQFKSAHLTVTIEQVIS